MVAFCDVLFLIDVALGRQYTCSDIESHLQDCYSNGIPDTVDATAIHDLCFESIEHWEAPMRLFLNKTEKMVKALLVDLVKDVFSDYHRTALMGKVKSIVTKLCDQVQKEEHILAARFYECERVRQATLDIESHRTAEEEALKRLKVMYVVQPINDSLTETEPENKKTEGSDRAKIVNKQLQSENLDTLKCSPALAVIAKVQAYYKIAMSRFVDNIFLSVQAQVFARIAVEISAALEQRLGLLDRDGEWLDCSSFSSSSSSSSLSAWSVSSVKRSDPRINFVVSLYSSRTMRQTGGAGSCN